MKKDTLHNIHNVGEFLGNMITKDDDQSVKCRYAMWGYLTGLLDSKKITIDEFTKIHGYYVRHFHEINDFINRS